MESYHTQRIYIFDHFICMCVNDVGVMQFIGHNRNNDRSPFRSNDKSQYPSISEEYKGRRCVLRADSLEEIFGERP